MQEADPDAAIKGKVLLEGGARQSSGNDPRNNSESMEELMRRWEDNRIGRTKIKKKKRMPLKGLFGGGE